MVRKTETQRDPNAAALITAMRDTADTAEADDDARPGRAAAAMRGVGPLAEGDEQLAQVLMARLFPTQIARPKLGRFDLLEFLGEGGMGSVYLAYDARLDRRVAVKFLRNEPAGDNKHAEARLLREAQALARLSHPNIVHVHEVWEEAGRVHVAMEYVQGESLAAWQRTPHPWRAVVDAYRQAGEGLAAAHAADLVHRDFKPHNAIRGENGVVKVLDFGLARIGAAMEPDACTHPAAAAGRPLDADATTPSLTRTGAIMGTPVYMAPEQHEGAPADARSDQYSFCVSLWEGLYGHPPYSAGSLAELREAVLAGHPGEPSDTRGLPGWVRRVLERGLARDPAARFPSMRALLRELARDPALRRRRVLAASALVMVALGGGLAIAELRARDASPGCTTAAAATAELWGPGRSDAARDGVLTAAMPAPARTWSLLEPHLTAYAAAIAAMRSEACETHQRGLQSDARYDLRVACLARREAGFVRLVDLLAAGDNEAVLHATTAVAELPALASCADADALASELPPPDDPQRAARVAELRQELARAQAEESAGKYVAAESRAAAVNNEANKLGHPPLIAEALLRWGSASMQRGGGEARTRLDAALWAALRAEHRSVAAEAAVKRIFARLEIDDRSADVSEAIALAQSLVERVGASDWRTRWMLANNTAIARERRGELTRALAVYEQALGLVPAGRDGVFERAATLQNMAPLQVRLGQRVAGEQAARDAVNEFRALYGPKHPSTASAEAVLAVVLARLGHQSEAAALLAAAIADADPTRPPLWMVLEAARLAQRRDDQAGALAWCTLAEPQLRLPDGTRSPWALPFAAVRARVAARAGDAQALALLDSVDGAVRASNPSFVALERAEVLWTLGRRAEAEASARSLTTDVSVAESERDDVRLLLARALVARAALAEGAAILRELLGADGGARFHEPERRALALQTLAEAEASAGRPYQGAALAREAVQALTGFDEQSPALLAARRVEALVSTGTSTKP